MCYTALRQSRTIRAIAALIALLLAMQPLASPVLARDDPGVALRRRLPIVTSWYNPELGGINCDPGGGCSTFGGGALILPEHYGASAACLTEWRGRTVVIPGFGRFVCRDSGGAVKRAWERGAGHVIRVDVLSKTPIQRGPWETWWLD